MSEILMPPNRDESLEEYAKWFVSTFNEGQTKEEYIKKYNREYYEEVIRLFKEEINTGKYNLAPRTLYQWQVLQRKFIK